MKTTALRAATCGLLLSAACISLAHPYAFVMAVPTAQERIDALNEKRQGILDASQVIMDGLTEDVDLTDEQTETITANTAEVEKIDKQIVAFTAMVPKGNGRKTSAELQNGNQPSGNRRLPAAVRDSARHNFAHLGEMAMAVRAAKSGDFENEGVKKLLNAATTYGNEAAGADGGYLVPPEFSKEIWSKVLAEENLMTRCTQIQTGSNSFVIPKDETNPAGTSGMQVYWDGEANTLTQKKGVFETTQLRLGKLTALAPVSDEMLEDAIGFESWIKAKVPGLMAQAINTGVVSGNGVGKPYGILQAVLSGSGLSVAKETSQPAATVWFANINKMWSRMYAPWRRNAIWLINQDIEPSLHGMAFQATGAASMLPGTSAVPAYLPMNGLSGSPYATLMGRPVVPVQACSTVGTQGDILLVDLNQYLVLTKASGIRTDTSIHLYFDQDITAFRWVFRINGMPLWSSVITPQNGSNTLSWAVALDNR